MKENENSLTREELKALDVQIDALVPSFELLRTNRRRALRAILTEFDALVQSFGTELDLAQRSLAYRGAYNALDHGIRWIFEHCPEESSFVLPTPEIAALELLTCARDYHDIFVQMSLAFRGRNRIARIAGERFQITSATAEDRQLETARSLMAAGEYPGTPEETIDLPPNVAEQIKEAISIDGVSARQLKYSFSKETYDTARTTMEERRLYKWSMNPDWDLGGYTFGDLRRVWESLKTLQALHNLALQKLHRQQDRRRLNLKIQTRDSWITEISKCSGLDADIVELVFADLVYDPRLHQPGRKRSHVMYQPFIEMGTDEVAQSNSLVMMSVIEKCSWILTELLRPNIHDRLKTLKERYWIDEEFKPFESECLKIFPHLAFTLDDKAGDIDLLFIDVCANIGLVAQLKWTTALDNVAGVESDDKQYAIGVQQAIRSLKWVEANRPELARHTGITASVLKSTIFHPIVIAKETLPSGTFVEGQVPVINEALFRWIMKEPHNATLQQLWKVASESRYLPQEGVHFARHDPSPIRWGTFEFTLKDVAYVPLPRRWDPARDIALHRT